MLHPGIVFFMHTALTMIIALSLMLNFILVLYIIRQYLRLRFFRFKDKLLLSMAISDILRAIVGYALEIRVGTLTKSKSNSQHQCDAAAFTISFLSYSSIYHLVLMTFDRWLYIAKQRVAVKFHASGLRTSLVLLLSWLASFVIAVFPLFGFGAYGYEDRGIRCSVDWRNNDLSNRAYHILLFVTCFFVPLLAMIVFYIVLRKFLRDSRDSMTGVFEQVTTRAIMKARYKAEGRITSMFFAMAFVFVVSWSPYAVLSFVHAFSSTSIYASSTVQSVAVIPAKASTLYNPIVIAWYDQSFKKYLLGYFKCNSVVCRANHQVAPMENTAGQTSKENLFGKPVRVDI